MTVGASGDDKDRTSLGLYFAKKPVEKPFKSMVIPGRFLMIPPGSEHFPVHGGIELDQDCRLYSVMPHMHKVGREIAVTLTPPGGQPTTLVAIKDWDYNWQETYLLEKPIDVKAGTKLRVGAYYDNSKKNPDSASQGWRGVLGEQTTDEMCFVFPGATSDKPGRIRTHPDWGESKPRAASKSLPDKGMIPAAEKAGRQSAPPAVGRTP